MYIKVDVLAVAMLRGYRLCHVKRALKSYVGEHVFNIKALFT